MVSEQKLFEALNSVRAKRGMGVVRKADKDTSRREATRVSLPRSQKKRKYNARHRQKSVEWLAKKKLEALDLHPSDLQTVSDTPINAIADVLAIPTAKVNIVANPPAGSYTGPSYKLPLPVPFGDAPLPEPVLTLSQARDRGLPTHYMGDTKVSAVPGKSTVLCIGRRAQVSQNPHRLQQVSSCLRCMIVRLFLKVVRVTIQVASVLPMRRGAQEIAS